MQILLTTTVKDNAKTVFAGFTRELFIALKPPLVPLKLLRFDGCKTGDEVHLSLGFNQHWVSVITQSGETDSGGIAFTDEGVKLPFFLTYWKHRHIIEPNTAGGSDIIDHITYKSHLPVLEYLLYPVLKAQFAARKPVYRRFFGMP
ncbi:MAG TPA: hypothetical protein PK239_07585 [Chitinophagales bacterium]|nr:hypothetical protein [Chitinophagales bacterium]HRK27137.1 hypothetical protein [Chitinophagales bacterium]